MRDAWPCVFSWLQIVSYSDTVLFWHPENLFYTVIFTAPLPWCVTCWCTAWSRANKTGACYSNCFTAKLTRKQRAAAVLHHSPSGPHICFKCTGLFPPLCNITPQPCNWQLHIFSLAQVMAIAARAAALRFPVSLQAKVRTMKRQHRCAVCDVNVPLEASQRSFIGV